MKLLNLIVIGAGLVSSSSPGVEVPREAVGKIVARIQQADYEGDRAALQKLHDELAPFTADKELAARVRYWSGFALWRKAINGFNEPKTDPKELETDLNVAISEFGQAISVDPKFADAKIGIVSCLGFALFLHQKDPHRVQELMQQMGPMTHELREIAPNNPRLAWVLGGGYWFIGSERGGGQDKAIETYEDALPFARKEKAVATDSLEPAWGEPELLMSLAWSHLNRAKPDLVKAEEYARSALVLVPSWHYVRDVLMAQITQAETKSIAR